MGSLAHAAYNWCSTTGDRAVKTALVYDWLLNHGGAEDVLMRFHHLFPEAPVFTSLHNPAMTGYGDVRTTYLNGLPGARRLGPVLAPLMPAAFEALDMKGYDLVLSSGSLAKGVVTHPGQVHVSYCHTPMRYVWGVGGETRGSSSWLRRRVAYDLRQWDYLSAQRVDHFIANSATTQARIAKFYRRDSEVIHPPVSVADFTVSEVRGEGYFAFGRLVPYKRFDLLIQAALESKRQLTIAGEGPEESHLRSLAGSSDLIRFVGRVSDTERNRLLGTSRAFLFGGEEDFGITPVQALATGTPVVAFGKGGVTESVRHEQEGIHFAEQSVSSVLAALDELEKRTFDPHVLRVRAEEFAPEVFDRKIHEFLEHHGLASA